MAQSSGDGLDERACGLQRYASLVNVRPDRRGWDDALRAESGEEPGLGDAAAYLRTGALRSLLGAARTMPIWGRFVCAPAP